MGALEKNTKTFQSSNQTDQPGKRPLVRDKTKNQTITNKARHRPDSLQQNSHGSSTGVNKKAHKGFLDS